MTDTDPIEFVAEHGCFALEQARREGVDLLRFMDECVAEDQVDPWDDDDSLPQEIWL